MPRLVSLRKEVIGDPDRFREALRTALPQLLREATGTPPSPPSGDGTFVLQLRTRGGGLELRKGVRVRLEEARQHGPWLSVPLRVTADRAGLLFPTFDGAVELEVHDVDRVGLALVGHYSPPMGPLGVVGDLMLLEQTAHLTLARLFEGLARALVGHVQADHVSDVVTVDPTRLEVQSVMSRGVLSLREDMTLRAAAHVMLIAGISGAPVIDDAGRLVGVLSERDLLDKVAPERTGLRRSALEAWRHHQAVTVGEACTRPARVTDAAATVQSAAAEMVRHDVDRLMVMQGARVVGILTRTDVLKALVRPAEDVAAAVQSLLTARGEHDVECDVEDGVVHLSGLARRRSDVLPLSRAVGEVDGVLSVSSEELGWLSDDLLPVPPMLG